MRVVHKFGGTSVGDARSIAGVADIVFGKCRLEDPVVVVSAMAGVTDCLVEGARAAAAGDEEAYSEALRTLRTKHARAATFLLRDSSEMERYEKLLEEQVDRVGQLFRSISVLGELTARTCDAVVCVGERLSANLLAAVLRNRGVDADAICATELIVTDELFGSATPLQPQTDERISARLGPQGRTKAIPIITGFIGATGRGVPTTLGRGGSDYSAAIIAAALDAADLMIWTDVDGILTGDPHIVPNARVLRELSYGEAEDLARFGAEVLHPRTIEPIISKGIRLRILNSFNPGDPGTLIVAKPHPERDRWPAIVSATGLSLISVRVADDAWRLPFAACALKHLYGAAVDVLMFTQSHSERNLNLVVRDVDQDHALKLLRRAFEAEASWSRQGTGSVADATRDWSIETKERVATVSVVGFPGWNEIGIASHTFAALGKHRVRIVAVAQAATEESISFCIPADQVTETVRALHRELGLEDSQ